MLCRARVWFASIKQCARLLCPSAWPCGQLRVDRHAPDADDKALLGVCLGMPDETMYEEVSRTRDGVIDISGAIREGRRRRRRRRRQ